VNDLDSIRLCMPLTFFVVDKSESFSLRLLSYLIRWKKRIHVILSD
jgi:hypothetical protein